MDVDLNRLCLVEWCHENPRSGYQLCPLHGSEWMAFRRGEPIKLSFWTDFLDDAAERSPLVIWPEWR